MRAGNADPAVASDYRSTCKQVKMLVNRSRSSFEAGLAANAKRNPKGVYAYIKRQCISRDTVSSMYNVDRALVTDKQEVACVLNKQFHSVFTSDTNKALPEQTPLTATDKQPTLDNAFSYHNVHRQLSALNKNKSQGPDGIHPHVVKECADVFATILSLFFTKSYTNSSIPAA